MLNSKDASLFERLRHHDEDAWALLFKEQYGILCVVASGYLKDDYVAESVVSDVLYNFYIKISSLNLSVSIRSYLIQAVRNYCVNVLKKKEPIFYDPYNLSQLAEKMSEGEHPIGKIFEKELETIIRDAISQLSPRGREIFEMSRFEGLSYNEIADKLGISVNTVKYHIKQSLMALRQKVGDYLPIALLIVLINNN